VISLRKEKKLEKKILDQSNTGKKVEQGGVWTIITQTPCSTVPRLKEKYRVQTQKKIYFENSPLRHSHPHS
jgi:hypothetical protein